MNKSYTTWLMENGKVHEKQIMAYANELRALPERAGGKGAMAVKLGLAGAEQVYQAGDMTADTPIVMASPTKFMTTAVILKLVETGELSLDAPISTWLDDLPEAYQPITLRQLLSHTAGVGTDSKEPVVLLMGDFDPLAAPEESYKNIIARPLMFAPGSAFKYDGRGVQLAGHVAEMATGQTWAALFEETMRAPLELRNSWYGVPGKPDIARDAVTNPSIAGGFYSSTRDMGRFVGMLLNRGMAHDGSRILKPSSIDQLRLLHTKDIAPLDGFAWMPFSEGYALTGWCAPPLAESCGKQYLVGEYGATIIIDWANDKATLGMAEGSKGAVPMFAFAMALANNTPIEPAIDGGVNVTDTLETAE